ncbi:MAG TPA: hypothetical protein VK249_16285 [Anaerolineales bacterium]|nr:hypothetical protein [Anaerolineales bacterium]
MKSNEIIETKVAQTAFCWLEYNYYGSETDAIKSLLKRKGAENLNQDTARQQLAIAIQVLKRTKELREITVSELGKSSVSCLTQDEFTERSIYLETLLKREFPGLEVTINYMLGMVWRMPYWR